MAGRIASRALGILAAALFAIPSAQATPITGLLDDHGGSFSGHSNHDVGGYVFRIENDIEILSLGMLVDGTGSLVQDHHIGIYTGQGVLLVGATVSQGATPDSQGYTYAALSTPHLLTAGTGNYFIGVHYKKNSGDRFLADNNNGKPIMADGIEFRRARVYFSGGSAIDPSDLTSVSFFQEGVNSNRTAFIGPNFTFQSPASSTEPVTLALLGVGLMGVGLRRRRRSGAFTRK